MLQYKDHNQKPILITHLQNEIQIDISLIDKPQDLKKPNSTQAKQIYRHSESKTRSQKKRDTKQLISTIFQIVQNRDRYDHD